METRNYAGVQHLKISRVVFVSANGEDATHARSAMIEALGTASVFERVSFQELEAVGIEQADLVIVAATPGFDIAEQIQQVVKSKRPRLLFVLLAGSSREIIETALREGADEVLFAPLRAGELTRALLRVSETRRTAQKTNATVCTFTSLTGGSGVTTLAVGLATAIQRTLGRRAVLVDLDARTAAVAGALDLEPVQTIAELSQTSKLDSIELEAVLTRHSSGLYLLAAPRHLDDYEAITPELVANVISVAREIFDFVVIDGGSHVDDRLLAAWENSDRLFYVVNQSVGSVRAVLRLRELLQRLEVKAPRPQLVLNRRRDELEIGPEHISETLQQPIFFQVAYDEKAARAYGAAGDLWAAIANSQLARVLEKMAGAVAGIEASAVRRERHGLFGLLRRVGAAA